MQKLIIVGGKKLNGSIHISGSKNATLPILAASILSKNKIIIENIPLVKDVETMIDLLLLLGLKVKLSKKRKKIEILNGNKLNTFVPYKLVKTMRAGILVLGPLLARYNKAKVSLPGGCAIGSRPVDVHLDALKKMGVHFKIKEGYINAVAKAGLIGNKITLDNGETVHKFTTNLSDSTYTPQSSDNVSGCNTNSCWGLTGWELNTPQSIAGKTQGDSTWWSKGTSAYGKYTLDGSELFFCVSMNDYPSSSCLPTTGWFKQ